MEKKTFIFIITTILLAITIISLILYIKNIEVRSQDIPNQCYSKLQPSQFITLNQLPDITTNNLQHTITIKFNTEKNVDTNQVLKTGSMRPAISDYSILLTIEPTKSDLFIGDIIIFSCGNQQMVHRIIKITNNTYITKGDNNAVDDTTGFGCNTKFEDIEKKIIGVIY